jgi:hypothetical protein
VWQNGGVKAVSSIIRTARRHRTDEEIAGILQDHQRSGLSLLAFARTQGLCYASLLRWRSRSAARGKPPVARDPEADPGFVAVKLQDERPSGDYVLSWPTGTALKIPPQFQTDSLRRLLSVLEVFK